MPDIQYTTEAKVFLDGPEGSAVVTYIKGTNSIRLHNDGRGIDLHYDQLRALYCVAPEIMNDLRP